MEPSRHNEGDWHDARTVLHWYDFLCPFCYLGQHRTAILVQHGLRIIELPFQAHPDIPAGGIPMGPRTGHVYSMLQLEAKELNVPLHWPPRLPNTERALAAAEWVRRNEPDSFPGFHKDLFRAHFALGENLEDPIVIDRHAVEASVDLEALHAALADGTAETGLAEAKMIGIKYGVHGTPAWLIGQRLISGLLAPAEFERFAERAKQSMR
jgi:predicted DsbA family dithiol-disulfide isomerase